MRNRTLLIAGLVFALGSLVGASLTTPGWRFGASMRDHMARMWGAGIREPFASRGDLSHDLSIPSLDFQLGADPESRSVGSLTLEQGDEVSIECTVPGHAQAGMTGVLVATSG